LKAAAGNRNDDFIRHVEKIRPSTSNITHNVSEAAVTNGKRKRLNLLARWAGLGAPAHHWVHIAELRIAADAGDTTQVSQLIKLSTAPDREDSCGRTPLYLASPGSHVGVVSVLLATNAVDVNLADEYHRTPLWWAAFHGSTEIVQLLLDHRARRDCTDYKDSSAPDRALGDGFTEIEHLLIKHIAERSSGGTQKNTREGHCANYPSKQKHSAS
jgi:ankyrin repeat protein